MHLSYSACVVTLSLLRSAYEAGRPQVSSLRAWMTFDHVAATYRVPLNELAARLALPPDTSGNESLKDIADKRNVGRFDFVQQVQRVVIASAYLAGIAPSKAA